MERVTDCILGGFKITADGDCRHEIIRCLLFGRKVMINLGSIIKSRDFTLPTKVYLVKAMVFFSSHVRMWVGLRKLSTEELMLLNCGVGEDSWESLGLQGIQPVHPKGYQSWIFIGRTDAEAETPILWPPDAKNITWKRPWCWKRLKTEGEGDNRGWDGWMASLIQWTWVWVNSGSWWWTGRPGVLQSLGLQTDGHDWATELKWNWISNLRVWNLLYNQSLIITIF